MKYILFGTGDYYKRFRHWFVDRDVVTVLDNDEKKQGTYIDQYPIVAPADIRSLKYDAVVILSFYVTEMKKQLVELGVIEEKIFHFYDLYELFRMENAAIASKQDGVKSILLLSHDLTYGGPALALFHAAVSLRKAGYEVIYASMLDGELRTNLEDSFIPVVVDERLQVDTMKELRWTRKFDLIVCNTINFNVFLSDRDTEIPVLWWLHDAPFFYEGIRKQRLADLDMSNMRILSVGPVPRMAMTAYKPGILIDDLIYGVTGGV